MIALLLDQGLPRSTAVELRRQGWNIAHVGEIGMSQADDTAILAYAREHNQTIVTLDADFHALLAVASHTKPSVIRIRIEGLNGEALTMLLQKIWPTLEKPLSQGVLVTVTENRIRIRHLPIG